MEDQCPDNTSSVVTNTGTEDNVDTTHEGIALARETIEEGCELEDDAFCSLPVGSYDEEPEFPCEIVIEDGSEEFCKESFINNEMVSDDDDDSGLLDENRFSESRPDISFDDDHSSDSRCSIFYNGTYRPPRLKLSDGDTLLETDLLSEIAFRNDLQKLPNQNQEILMFIYQTMRTPFSKISKYLASTFSLSYADVNNIRKLRRQIKNRLYAKNCRKRKLDHMRNLARELSFIKVKKESIVSEKKLLLEKKRLLQDQCNALHAFILRAVNERWEGLESYLANDCSLLNNNSDDIISNFPNLRHENCLLKQRKKTLISKYNQLYAHIFKELSLRFTADGKTLNGDVKDDLGEDSHDDSLNGLDKEICAVEYSDEENNDGGDEGVDSSEDDDEDEEEPIQNGEVNFGSSDNHEQVNCVKEQKNKLAEQKTKLTEEKRRIEERYLQLYKHTFQSAGIQHSAALLQQYMGFCIQLLNVPGLEVLNTPPTTSSASSTVSTSSLSSLSSASSISEKS